MSDNEIRAGDLVMILHTCCIPEYEGMIATVERLFISTGNCGGCHAGYIGTAACKLKGMKYGYALSWLKKINPPPISESTEREKELTL